MGCVNIKVKKKNSSEPNDDSDFVIVTQDMYPNSEPIFNDTTNVIENDAAKQNLLTKTEDDIYEKESFHSIFELGKVLGKGNFSVVRKCTKMVCSILSSFFRFYQRFFKGYW